jgi:hypothetical protein
MVSCQVPVSMPNTPTPVASTDGSGGGMPLGRMKVIL